MTNTTAFPEFMDSFVSEVAETCSRHGLQTPGASLSGIWHRYDGGDRFITVEVSRWGTFGAQVEVLARGFRGEPDLAERRVDEELFPVFGARHEAVARFLDWLDDTLADAVGLLRR